MIKKYLVKVTANLPSGNKIVHITRTTSCKVARDRLAVAYPTIVNMKAQIL